MTCSVPVTDADSRRGASTLQIEQPLDRLIFMNPDMPLTSLSATPTALIEMHLELVDAYVSRSSDLSTAETRVLQRQRSMLVDLQEAVSSGVPTVDLAYEGDFDPVADALESVDTEHSRGMEIHKVALAGIEPIVQAVRAYGISVHAPELDLDEEIEAEDTQFAMLAAEGVHAI